MDTVVVPLLSRRRERAQLGQKINHVIPAAGLLVTGAQALTEGARGFGLALAVVEIGTSAMLGVTVLRSLREIRRDRPAAHGHSHGVDWIDIWAAGVLFAEAAERWQVRHHISRPTLLTALVTLALGLFHDRIAAMHRRRRALRITPHGIHIGDKPFRAFSSAWRDMASISMTDRVVEVRTQRGRVRRVDLADLRNADEVRAAFAEASRRLAASRGQDPMGSRTSPVSDGRPEA